MTQKGGEEGNGGRNITNFYLDLSRRVIQASPLVLQASLNLPDTSHSVSRRTAHHTKQLFTATSPRKLYGCDWLDLTSPTASLGPAGSESIISTSYLRQPCRKHPSPPPQGQRWRRGTFLSFNLSMVMTCVLCSASHAIFFFHRPIIFCSLDIGWDQT